MHRLNYKCAFSRCFQFKGFCLLLGLNIPLLLPFALCARDEPNYERGCFGGGCFEDKGGGGFPTSASLLITKPVYLLKSLFVEKASLHKSPEVKEKELLAFSLSGKQRDIFQRDFCKLLIVNFTAINNETEKELIKYYYKKDDF